MRNKASLVRRLSTSRAALPSTYVSINLGGTTVCALKQEDLDLGLAELVSALEDGLGQALMVTKQAVIDTARRLLASPVSDRLAGAALGRILSTGKAGVVPCLTVNRKVFRLYVRADRYSEFESWVSQVGELLRERMTLTANEVVQIEAENGRSPINWFCANQILCHLAYRGVAIWVGDEIFVSTERALLGAGGVHHD